MKDRTDHKPRIAVVDDDPLILEAIAGLLGQYGYAALPFEKASEALENLSRNDIDVVLTDINMPGMSGLELLDKIMSQYPRLPVILMTAYPENRSVIDSRGIDGFDFLLKPFSADHLIRAVEKALGHGAVGTC